MTNLLSTKVFLEIIRNIYHLYILNRSNEWWSLEVELITEFINLNQPNKPHNSENE